MFIDFQYAMIALVKSIVMQLPQVIAAYNVLTFGTGFITGSPLGKVWLKKN